MLLLPVTNPLGVLGVPEVLLVLGLGQPSPLELAFPGLAAVGFEAIALALANPIIGKKQFLAVQALVSRSRRLRRFHNQKEPVSENGESRRKKIQPEEDSERRRRKKSFQRILRRKSRGRRSPFTPSVSFPFHFNGDTWRASAIRIGKRLFIFGGFTELVLEIRNQAVVNDQASAA
jgi:hypothetical protein